MHEALIERALDARLSGEDARKAEYIIDQLMYGRRDDADSAILADTLKRIVR
jgi:hypothetical protein